MNSLKRKQIEDKVNATVLNDIKLLAEDVREKKQKAAKLCCEAADSERKLKEALASAEEMKAKMISVLETRIEKAAEWRTKIPRPVTLKWQWVCNVNSDTCAVMMMGPREPQPLVANLIRHLVPDRDKTIGTTHSLVEWYSEVDGAYHKGFVASASLEFSEEEGKKLEDALKVKDEWKPVREMSLYCEETSIGWHAELSQIREKPIFVPTDGTSIRVDWLSTTSDGKYSEVEWYANDGQHYRGWVDSGYVSLPRDWKGKHACLAKTCNGTLRLYKGPRRDVNYETIAYGNEKKQVHVINHNQDDLLFSLVEIELDDGVKHKGWIDSRLLTYPIF